MRVLVTWGSKLGGTKGIAQMVAEELERHGVEVALMPAEWGLTLRGYDAVIVGGALYASRWHKSARRFVTGNVVALRRVPVWMFSSGPLDDSADRESIPPVREVAAMMERVGALGHVTFGGRLPADAKGFPASAMAKKRAGDWRNPEKVRAWAAEVAEALPRARPATAREPAGQSFGRLLAHGAAGWALCAAAITGFGGLAPGWLAVVLHVLAAPVVFAGVSYFYFRAPGARPPLVAALGFTVVVAALHAAVVAQYMLRSFDMFGSITGTWLPFALIFLATWATGAIMAMLPEPGARKPRRARAERPSMLSGPPAAGTP